MRVLIIAAIVLTSATGCVSRPPEPQPPIEYREIPEGYLQPCELPDAPTNNGELSEAFVVAYQCAEIGNRDKQRIRDLTRPEPES